MHIDKYIHYNCQCRYLWIIASTYRIRPVILEYMELPTWINMEVSWSWPWIGFCTSNTMFLGAQNHLTYITWSRGNNWAHRRNCRIIGSPNGSRLQSLLAQECKVYRRKHIKDRCLSCDCDLLFQLGRGRNDSGRHNLRPLTGQSTSTDSWWCLAQAGDPCNSPGLQSSHLGDTCGIS